MKKLTLKIRAKYKMLQRSVVKKEEVFSVEETTNKFNRKKKCKNCGKTGHLADFCWDLSKNKGRKEAWMRKNGKKANGDSSGLQCWICGGQHKAYQCDKKYGKKNEDGNLVTDEAVLDDELSLMVSDENLDKNNFPSDLWVGDTGATYHMGPSLAGCTDIK